MSNKLFEWTNERWIITLSKSQGQLSINDQKKSKKSENINSIKESNIYKSIIEKFSDAELIDINKINKKD